MCQINNLYVDQIPFAELKEQFTMKMHDVDLFVEELKKKYKLKGKKPKIGKEKCGMCIFYSTRKTCNYILDIASNSRIELDDFKAIWQFVDKLCKWNVMSTPRPKVWNEN